MSDTNTARTRTLRAVPTTEPPTDLAGAPAAIYTALTRLTEPVTAAELALAAGVGRSTAGKALTTLEERGLAIRIPGGYEGHRRTPDHWHCANHSPSEPAPADTQPEPAAPQTPTASTAGGSDAPVGETTREAPATPDDGTTAPAADDLHDTQPPPDIEDAHPDGSGEDGPPPSDGGNDDSTDEDTPAPQASPGRQEAPARLIPASGEKKRLIPGALRQMVTEHLQAHPGEAFTATKISRAIEKSSGAIANALVILARQGIAEQVTDKPRTYRAATTHAASTK